VTDNIAVLVCRPEQPLEPRFKGATFLFRQWMQRHNQKLRPTRGIEFMAVFHESSSIRYLLFPVRNSKNRPTRSQTSG